MTLKSFPAYRNSDIEWVGPIPADWQCLPIFAAVSESRAKNTGLKNTNLLSLSYGNIVRKDINLNDGLLPESFETYQIVMPSDVVFRLTDLQNDTRSLRSAIVREQGIITSAYLAVSLQKHDPEYFAYLMRSYDLQKVFYSMGGGLRQSMKFDDIKHLPVLTPPLELQRQIADYLDAQTAKIDALIGKQEQLIETLVERRQAVISHAVTKGLDPNAPMKDSAVDWLGEVPTNWSILAIKYVASAGGGFAFESEDFLPEGDTPVVKQGDLFQTTFATFTNREVPRQFLVQTGDVLVAMSGDFKSVFWERGEAALNQRSMLLRAKNGTVVPQWLAYSLPFVLMRLERLNASTTINNLSSAELLSAKISVPSISEQRRLVDHLDNETSKIDALSAKAREMIDILKERRQALISAAVTGKIDVRGLT